MSARIHTVGPEAAELFAAVHAEAFPKPWPAADFQKLLATPGAFGLVVAADGPCAVLAAWTAADEAEILTLAVTPQARRRGFGRDLVSAAIAEAGRRGARGMFLEVAADNAGARALYEALGFRAAGRRRNYYQNTGGASQDAIVLRLELVVAPAPLDLHARRP
jgi:ribosomal-protein-alanine N-acetyltransferase